MRRERRDPYYSRSHIGHVYLHRLNNTQADQHAVRADVEGKKNGLACYRAFNIHQIWFTSQQLRSLIQDPQRLIVRQSPLPQEMLFEEIGIGSPTTSSVTYEELTVCGCMGYRWCNLQKRTQFYQLVIDREGMGPVLTEGTWRALRSPRLGSIKGCWCCCWLDSWIL